MIVNWRRYNLQFLYRHLKIVHLMRALQLLEKYKKIQAKELVEETLLSKREQIIQQQIEQQQEGQASTGKAFINSNTGKDEYSPGYAKKKGKTKPIDLHVTGQFQRAIFMDVREDKFVLDSADDKTEKLLKQFGGNIFGLSNQSKASLKPIIQKELKEQFLTFVRKL